MKPDFDRSERLARELLLSQITSDFSFDFSRFVFDRDIIIDTFNAYGSIAKIPTYYLTARNQYLSESYVIHADKYRIILYDESLHSNRIKWSISHELGHTYCNHSNDDEKSEKEAHWFAAELLACSVFVYEIYRRRKKLSSSDLCSIFPISLNAADKRISGLNRMCKHSDYLKNELLAKYDHAISEAVNRIDLRKKSYAI